MNSVLSTYAHPRFVPLAILLASSAVLITALAAQHLFGLEPCALCIYQRVPYVITAMVAITRARANPAQTPGPPNPRPKPNQTHRAAPMIQ